MGSEEDPKDGWALDLLSDEGFAEMKEIVMYVEQQSRIQGMSSVERGVFLDVRGHMVGVAWDVDWIQEPFRTVLNNPEFKM